MTTSSRSKIWLLVMTAAIILLITSGIRLSLGLYIEPISVDTPVSIVQLSFALAVMQFMWGVSQPIVGALADKYGTLWVLLGGTLLLAMGCLLTPMMLSAWGVVLTLGVMIAFGAGAGSFSVLMGQVANLVPTHLQGVASGIINAGSSFGQFIFAPFIQLLIATSFIGWQRSFFVVAVVSLLCLPLSYMLAHQGAKTTISSTTATSTNQSLSRTIVLALKDRNYLLIHLAFFTCGFHVAFLVTHLPIEVTLAGLKADVASWSLAIIGLSNVVGSLFVGWSVGRWRCKYILLWMYLSRVLLIGIYLLAPKTATSFYLFAIGLGLTWLATIPPTAGAIGKLCGIRYLATLFGLTLLSHQIGGFLGAYFGGLAVDIFGNYTYMWYTDMALAFLAAISNLPIKEPPVQRHNKQ